METMLWKLIEEYAVPLNRQDMPKDVHAFWMETRKQAYECQNWYNDVWEEYDLIMFLKKNVPLRKFKKDKVLYKNSARKERNTMLLTDRQTIRRLTNRG